VPGVSLQGYQEERTLEVLNKTPEPLHVWVQAMSRSRQKGWSWLPSGSEDASQAWDFYVSPHSAKLAGQGRESNLLRTEAMKITGTRHGGDLEAPVSGSALRWWAESESGRFWTGFKTKQLWLVPETDAEGRHRYYADQMARFSLSIEEDRTEHAFKER